MLDNRKVDILWDDNPVDISAEANFIWSIANKLRGTYMPDKYGDVIIPMTIIRRFECALAKTKNAVVAKYKESPNYPAKAMYRISGYSFYNTSEFTLQELCNDADHIAENFKAYIQGFSTNIQDILNNLDIDTHIKKMDEGGCLFNTVKAFSELDLSVETFDSIKMGYIFENLIGRFFQNVDAGQFYTGRDIIKLGVSLLISEGCDDIFDDGKIITICDQAAGTGGMLSTAYSYLKHYNPSVNVKLFGVELMGVSWAVGMAEMLIKGQDASNFVHTDSFKEDPSAGIKMRFCLENPPFGTPWAGKDAKAGQEEAVNKEFAKDNSRWGAGLPGGGDSQMIFLQSAIAKLDEKVGRAAIIENGSPLFTGGTASGESQIRRWLLENDLLEAIVAMPTDLFYNTGIASYWWIISKNKRKERRGYVQLIDATNIYHKLRKPIGNKKNEFSPEDRAQIAKLYTDFKENEYSKIFKNEDFMYREYAVMQPLQRSYSITDESIERMLQKGALKGLWDEAKVVEYEEQGNALSGKDQNKLEAFYKTKPIYEAVLEKLQANISAEKWLSPKAFMPVLVKVLDDAVDSKTFDKIMDGLSIMDKDAEIQKDRKGNIIYDKDTKDTELVKYTEDIDTYMAREVLPHVPDAKWFWEEDLGKKKPVIKTGAEIPFTRYFYKYQAPKPSEELLAQFLEIDKAVNERIARLMK